MSDAFDDLPGALRPASSFPFVGRAAELERLRTLLPLAAGEQRRVVLLAGEPGSGKSRLLREFAAEAVGRGAHVLHGACDAVVPTPYGPFAEALDPLVRADPADDPLAAMGPGATPLVRLLPALAARAGAPPAPAAEDPDTERHRLHTAVADLLAGAARQRPLLLVLEDCHWADAPTLLLLRHLARTSWGGRVLLVATFRDTEAELTAELSETLADLRRCDDVARMRLGSLSAGEVAAFVERAAGCAPDPGVRELAAAIHDLTEGNAFLVCELWRALVETGAVALGDGRLVVARPLRELATPDSVREVVSQRLARLGPRTTELLELAATVGPDFELDVVRRAAGLAERELLAALEEATASGMVEELPGARLACRFAHELVRRAVYDRLSRARRAELHLRVAEALAAGPSPERSLADLAHHFSAAAPLGGSERAVRYNVAAARAAAAALAFGEAAARLRTAVELGVEDRRERAATLIELGMAEHRAGRATAACEAFAGAAELARELDSGELLARAAIGYEDACWRPTILDHVCVELLEEAIPALGDERPELRVALLAGLARALDLRGDRTRGAIVRGNAIELARRLDDRAGLAKLLVRSYWSRGTSPPDEVLAMLTEAKELAEELGDAETRAEAMAWRVPTFVAMCDLDGARAETAALRQMAERTAQPFMHHVAEHYGAAIALSDGRLAEAEAMAERSHEWARLLSGRDASGTYGIQMFSIRREQGRLAELAPAVRVLAGAAEREGPWRPGLVAVLVELGMEREARRELAALVADGLDGLRTSLWTATLAYLADACAALGDAATAALVYPELEPLAGGNVMIGHLVCCYGAADRHLGMLAATLGEPERAERHFERALELNRRMAMPTWVAHTAYQYARFLHARGGGAARERARTLAGEAAGLARRIGMRELLERAAAIGGAAPGGELPVGLSPREAQILGLVARGLSNREIGRELSISEHTAANHVRSILRKSDCANRTEAASFAHRHGLASTTI